MQEINSISVEYAGFWRRLIAFIIDQVVLLIPLSILSLLISPVLIYPLAKVEVFGTPQVGPSYYRSTIQNLSSATLSIFLIGLIAAFGFLLVISYFVILTSHKGGTLGKLLLHLKVVNKDGDKITMERALLRYTVGYFISSFGGLGFLWVVFDERKQGWHDKIAGTFVVQEKRLQQPASPM